jgi:hypothetical protein
MHTQQVYKCIVPCRKLADFLNHKLRFRDAWVRAIVYTGLSFTLFTAGALQVRFDSYITVTESSVQTATHTETVVSKEFYNCSRALA